MRITRWLHGIHQWCGLIAGLNMLVLSITGAYLVFAEDIEHLFGHAEGALIQQMPLNTESPVQDAMDLLAMRHPDAIPAGVRPVVPGEPVYALAFLERPETLHRYVFDPRNGELRTEVESTATAINHFILHLHADLFLGMIGVLIIGVVSILFLFATLSGIIIYAPFMKRAFFGALRFDKGVRRGAADLHKLVGSSALAFNLVIAITGILLTFGFLAARMWAANEVRIRTAAAPASVEMPAPDAKRPPVDLVLRHAAAIHPEAPISSVTFPGSFQGPNHYFCFHERQGKLQQFMPVYSLVPMNDPAAADDMQVPLWIDLTMASIPLHFGNYGGLLIKVVYCVLGLGSGFLTVTGAILTFTRWRKKLRARRALKREAQQDQQGQLSPTGEA